MLAKTIGYFISLSPTNAL